MPIGCSQYDALSLTRCDFRRASAELELELEEPSQNRTLYLRASFSFADMDVMDVRLYAINSEAHGYVAVVDPALSARVEAWIADQSLHTMHVDIADQYLDHVSEERVSL